MKKYKTYDEIREDLDADVDIFWKNTGYKVFYEKLIGYESTKEAQRKMDAVKDDKMIVCRYLSNWFGGKLAESEIEGCFSGGES